MASYGSPYAPDMAQHPQPFTPPSGGQIAAGTVTYTTSTGPDGRVVYHPFKAVPASYQTPTGVVTGIQWIPAEATQVLPTGAQPANADFAASWNRGYLSRDDEKALKEWQRSEEKRRRKEEKDSAKRLDKWERERRDKDDDRELRKARDRDNITRERRKSFNQGASPLMGAGYPTAGSTAAYPMAGGAAGYPSVGSTAGGYGGGGYSNYDRDRKYSGGASDLDRRFGDLELDRQGYGRERKLSSSLNGDRPRKYSIGEADNTRRMSGNYGDRPGAYSTPPYGTAGAGYPSTNAYPVSGQYNNNTAGSQYGGGTAYPSSPNMRPRSPYPTTGSGYAGSNYPSSPGRTAEPFPRAPSPYAGPRAPSPYAGAGPRAPSPYAGAGPRAPSPYAGAGPRAPSPYAGAARAPSPFSGAGGPVFPRGHIMDGQGVGISPGQPMGQPMGSSMGQPMGQTLGRSRATTPIPGLPGGGGGVAFPSMTSFPQPGIPGASPMPSPRMGNASLGGGGYPGESQLATPEGFSRPRNAALSYTPFDTMKIQPMDDFDHHIPRMPLVLQPHDVYHEDWIRFTSDLALAWSGRLPVPELARGGRPPKRSTLAADLIDLWNSSFFLTRGVEVVIYKGRERRSGPNAGAVDRYLPGYDEDDYSDVTSSSSSSEDSDLSGDERRQYGGYGLYGRQSAAQTNDSIDARRRRREKKTEEKRRRKEKKQRKKAKERERRYALYLTCVQARDSYGSGQSTIPGGFGGMGGMGGAGGLGMTM